jgi:hypothetical protein
MRPRIVAFHWFAPASGTPQPPTEDQSRKRWQRVQEGANPAPESGERPASGVDQATYPQFRHASAGPP